MDWAGSMAEYQHHDDGVDDDNEDFYGYVDEVTAAHAKPAAEAVGVSTCSRRMH